MSAIAGLIYRTGKLVDANDLKQMGAALSMYGGSGGGAWQKGAAGLLQCQSISTPEDRLERQPLVSEVPSGVLVSASRLANRNELAQALGLETSLVSSAPDSLFFWHAHRKWGNDCPRHLIGDYTFAVWEEQKRRLFIAASLFSSQPLHYYTSSQIFAFATMPKGLFALEEVPRMLDEEYAAKYLARMPRAPDATFYCGIHRLLPGQTLVVQNGAPVLHTHRAWEPANELRFSSDAEYEEAFLDLYTQVVQDHLRSVTPVGVMLSGGLDSSSLAAIAAPLLGARNQRFAAYTEAPRAGFTLPSISARYADEVDRVQAIARLYDNLDVSILRPDGGHFLRNAAAYFHYAEIPFRNACNRLWIEAILGKARTQGVHVLLMGNMGNSTLSWKGKEADQRSGDVSWKSLLRDHVLPSFPSAVRQAASRLRDHTARLRAPQRAPLLRPDQACKHGIELGHGIEPGYGSRMANENGTASGDSAWRYEQLRKTTAQSANLWTGYQAMFGVEVRDPTGDERIIQFCLALPPDQFSRAGVSRRLIRRTMAGRLPAEILSSQRRGLQSADWFLTLLDTQGELRAELDRISHCDLANRLIDLAALRRSLDALPRAGQAGSSMDISLRNYLEHGLMTGRFLSWFETGE